MTLAACGTTSPGSVSGLKETIKAPPCAVRSTTRVGQRWIDGTVERGVAVLDWKRPQTRCADAQPRVANAKAATPAMPHVAPPAATEAAPRPLPEKKRRFWRSLIGR
jgi:hypothetical protein